MFYVVIIPPKQNLLCRVKFIIVIIHFMCRIVIKIINLILHDPQILNGPKTTNLVKNNNFLEVIFSNFYEVRVFLF